MSWIAPEVTRIDEPFAASERDMLEGWLEWHRATLLWKCAGLSGEQLTRRAVPPSSLSLLGLVRHMTEVERSWFRRRFAGESVGYLYCSDDSPDADLDDVAAASAEADFAAHACEVEFARAVHGPSSTSRRHELSQCGTTPGRIPGDAGESHHDAGASVSGARRQPRVGSGA